MFYPCKMLKVLCHRRESEIQFSENLKDKAFQRSLLDRNYLHGSISIKKTYNFREIVTSKHQMRRASRTLLFG